MAELKSEMHAYLEKVKSTIDTLDLNELNDALTALVAANERCAAIYVMGNGGSAATASHMVCDFNKGISNFSPNKFRMICLSDNLPTLSAIANDLSYDDVFFEQLRGALEPGDVVIAISGSGNSANVVKAVKYANEIGAVTLAMTGYDGGELKKLCRHSLHAAIMDMQISEDLHMIFDHMFMRVLCDYYSGGAQDC